MYDEGAGVPQDSTEAASWYRRAAEQGLTVAQYNLGSCYLRGSGVTQDDQKARQWYASAADQGFAHAQFELGLMYEEGTRVPQDYVQAHKWFNLAASQATEDTNVYRSFRDHVEEKMTAAQIAEAQQLVREWKPKAWEELKGRIDGP